MIELGVLADDITGGMMIASLLEGEGVRCPLFLTHDAVAQAPPGIEALVLARKIRLAPADVARDEARRAANVFQRLGVRRIYSKYSALFDSRRDGNIGPIAEVLLDELGAPATVFCAAYLERDVTVYQGRLFLGSTPLAESFKRYDPVTPAWSSNLVEVLQAQTERKVGLITRRTLRDEVALRARLDGARGPFHIVDAVDEDDLARVARLAIDLPLVTGGDSLAPAMARAWRRVAPLPGRRLLPPSPGSTAVLAGSCAPQTLAQIEAFSARWPVRRVDLAVEGAQPDLARQLIEWSRKPLAQGPVCIATSASPDAVAGAQARFGVAGATARADGLMGEIASGLFDIGVRKFVIAGGETSGAVLGALGVAHLEVSSYDELYGGYCHQPGETPLSFVVKAGSIGDGDFLHLALTRLEEADRSGIETEAS